MQYRTIVCGGTFDHFHKGHEAFLLFGLQNAEKLIIGLTSDVYTKHLKNAKSLEPFAKRKKQVTDFLQSKNLLDRVSIISIDDIFGPTKNADFIADAILVTESTKRGAEKINEFRKEHGIESYPLLMYKTILADDTRPVASSRIRNGEIDTNGKLFVDLKWLTTDLFITDSLREVLAKPFGKVIPDFAAWFAFARLNPETTVTVGDIITIAFNEKKFKQILSVVDLRTKRKKQFASIDELHFAGGERVIAVKNPAGSITADLFAALQKINFGQSGKKTIMLIDGEEDLAVLPIILVAPLGFRVYYGQPNAGVVEVIVDEMSKEKAYNIVSQFSTRGH
ncbi:MAG: pantetheine-phosphate adenylyltransferase [Bacteroidia bacterium]